jgi:hypothetical protein
LPSTGGATKRIAEVSSDFRYLVPEGILLEGAPFGVGRRVVGGIVAGGMVAGGMVAGGMVAGGMVAGGMVAPVMTSKVGLVEKPW